MDYREIRKLKQGDTLYIQLTKERFYTKCKILFNDTDDKQLDVVADNKNFIINYSEIITFKHERN